MLAPRVALMPTIMVTEHPRSMDFMNQRKTYILRTVHKMAWMKIPPLVRNLQGSQPSEWQCRDVVKNFSRRLGRKRYKYWKCGRKAWKVTKCVEKFLIQKLKEIRKTTICTSATLQRECLREQGVELECSTICKVLRRNGFKWVRRSKKPKYSKEDKAARREFAAEVLQMTVSQIKKRFAMSMDGVIIPMSPADAVDRINFCRNLETHMWRQSKEAKQEDFEAAVHYEKQLPYNRQLPLWGGIGPGGFGIIMFHKRRKVDQWEWSAALESGKLTAALRACRPDRQRGPWEILCDNESFLNAPASRSAHQMLRVELHHVPARSPRPQSR